MPKPSRPHAVPELAIVILFGLLYCALFLSAGDAESGLALRGLNPQFRILALEHERLAGLLIPAQIGLGLDPRIPGIGHLPAWNPYLGTGEPLINDAFFYLFNPFMSLPVLVMGAVQGTKVAIVIGLLIAGINMWAFARAIGLGGVARVMVASVYMMSGGIIAKYNNGHFQLGLSLAWPPLVFAGLWWTLHSRDRRAPVLMALAFALLFFSGNIYYTLHTLLCCIVIVIAHVIGRPRGRWQTDWLPIRRVMIGGVLALGLVMIQFLPVWTVRDYVSHNSADFDDSGQLIGQHDLGLDVANFVTPWDAWVRFQDPPINMWGAVDYAYIGPAVFALIAGLALALLFPGRIPIRHRRAALISGLLACVMMVWGAAQTEIVQQLYRHIHLLAEFRFLGRANTIAALWWIVLAGIALDIMWRAARTAPDTPTAFDLYDRLRILNALGLAGLIWLWLLLYTFSNNTSRLSLSLNNLSLFNTLNAWSFGTYLQAMQALINLVVLALIGDTILMLVRHRFLNSPAHPPIPLKKALLTRTIRIGLFALAVAAISDVMYVNYRILRFGPPGDNFGPLYAAASANDHHTNPFPSIQEPWSPSTFDSYYSRVRNWGLNEGWVPLPLENDIIPKSAPKLLNLPGWAISSAQPELGGTSFDLSQGFVQDNNGILVKCAGSPPTGNPDASCDLETNGGIGLYKIPAALPYAFVVPEKALKTRANTLTVDNVEPVMSVTHEMDTIQVIATPSTQDSPGQRDFLIVEETHFPGWHAFIDETETTSFTAGTHTPLGNGGGFIAIPMTPGTHTYTLRFEPPGFKTGILITALTLLVIVAYLAGVRWPSRPVATPVTIPPPAPATPEIDTPSADHESPQPVAQQPATPPERRATVTALTAVLVALPLAIALIYIVWTQKKAAIADSLTEVD